MSGHGETAFALHHVGFNEQHVAAGWRPGQAYHYSGAFGAFGDFAFAANFNAAEKFLNSFGADDQLLGLPFRQAAGLLPADGADVALQISHSGFARVMADEIANRVTREFDLLRSDAVLFNLPRDEILKRNMNFLLFRVTLQFDDLHAIAQRLGNRIEHVRGGDEEHFRQIERNVEIVVAERGILLGIKSFQQRRTGVAAEVAPDLINFIEHEHWVFGLGTANALNDLPR